ncbi:efflux RND transporter periplasmic adaptor subunit [Thermosulfurimonas sp. F29]|uniref:efflux RND transporter periplasmic adaptor subunit n=1 Tax=Thermosulfurimonas sp. F29 TaxID=2867247 RepID=UPI001C8398A9|nr:efflux RND transporter periplasmic adaptor subunit [Thermosulfurimonas sp. F29]MBX6422376.1 efflux RND transporter periplasmic adaptor subunit [Thermosulfurimonas sp. F29]
MRNPRWLVLALLFLGLLACKKEEGASRLPEGRTFSARIYTAVPRKAVLYREFPGTVESRQRARLSSKVAGFVREIPVREGDRVARGALLVRLDDRDIRARMRALSESTEALRRELAALSARLRFARAEYERYRRLFKNQAATAEEFEAKRAEYEALSAQRSAIESRIREVEARLNEVRTLLSYTEIRAPFSGRVVRKLVDAGTYVMPGQALVVMESEEAGRRVVCHPGEELYGRIRPGTRVFARIPSAQKSLALSVSEVVPEVDPSTRTFTVKMDLPRRTHLPSGTYARVFLPAGERTLLAVPAASVVDRGGFRAVFVVEEDRRVQLRVVRVGKRYFLSGGEILPVCLAERCEELLEVLSGLAPGEKVVLNPPSGLRSGDRVREE